MFTPASVSVVNVASTTANIHAAARRRLDRPPRVIAFDLRPLAPKRSRKLPSETTFTTTNVRSRARARSNASTRPLARIRINPSHRTASCARAHHRRRRRHLPLSRDADDDDDDRESFARRVASIETPRERPRVAGRGARFETTPRAEGRAAGAAVDRAIC